VEQVYKFKYLGVSITNDERCDTEKRMRIGVAKDAFSKRKKLLTKGMSMGSSTGKNSQELDLVVVFFCVET